jgi:hypothetical protein
MPEMDKKIAANKWATALEPGDSVPLEHELYTRYVVVQATDVNGASISVDYTVISDTRLQITVKKGVEGPITVVLVG